MLTYKRPSFLFSAHLETIYPALFRRVSEVVYERERIQTPDDDFLDLDWIRNGNSKLVIISHGLEGSTDRAYMKGMARAFETNKFDVLTWNFRGCSEEVNRQLRFYHSGATEDLDVVVRHARVKGYKTIHLVGFSLGGNLVLKYLGEADRPYIRNAATFSVPLNLHTSCIKIAQPSNFLYSRRFLRNLKKKVKVKAQAMPGKLKVSPLSEIKTLMEFDDQYTAPLHGFNNAIHYYESCSSINFLHSIKTPVLIVNAANDPFLSSECYPEEMLNNHPFVRLEIPKKGGHVGFAQFDKDGFYWSEKRAVEFISSGK